MSDTAQLVEVGVRDGLQNEPSLVTTADKLELLQRLANTGLRRIEATACVSPQRVPQMADYPKVLAGLMRTEELAPIRWSVLVANQRGLDAAATAPAVGEIALFTAASDAFTEHNIGCSVADSLVRFQPLVQQAKGLGLFVRAYVSTVVRCPYAGIVKPAAVAAVAEKLLTFGCDEISLGETLGVATPKSVKPMLQAVAAVVPITQTAVHFHDTNGTAIANIACALEAGIRIIDAAVAGLGGCPFAPGAGGNVATEDVLYFLTAEGIGCDVDLPALAATGRWISKKLSRQPVAKAGQVAIQAE